MRNLMFSLILLSVVACSDSNEETTAKNSATPSSVKHEAAQSQEKPSQTVTEAPSAPSPTTDSSQFAPINEQNEREYIDNQTACQAVTHFAKIDSQIVGVKQDAIQYKITLTNNAPVAISQIPASLIVLEKGKPQNEAIVCQPVAFGFMDTMVQPNQSISVDFDLNTKEYRCRDIVLDSQGEAVDLMVSMGSIKFADDSEIICR